jgi:DNA polymerase-4
MLVTWGERRERAIVHLNVADFAVAVERAADPSLQGRPVVVALPGGGRAVVYDMSEEAYQEGEIGRAHV